MKKHIALIMGAVMLLSLVACSGSKETPADDGKESRRTQTEASVWDGATYTEDTELGEGDKIIHFSVKAEDRTVDFTIHTDAETLGEALEENGLASGTESEYGLLIDTVDGMYADYSTTQTWWALYVDGEMASTGVDGVMLDEDTTASFDLTAA